jgi:hypothetical protein
LSACAGEERRIAAELVAMNKVMLNLSDMNVSKKDMYEFNLPTALISGEKELLGGRNAEGGSDS